MRTEIKYYELIREGHKNILDEIRNSNVSEEVKAEREVLIGFITRASTYVCYNILEPALDQFAMDLKKKSERRRKKCLEWLTVLITLTSVFMGIYFGFLN